MSVTNIVRAVVKPGSDYTVTSPIMKEDKGQIMLIEGLDLPEIYEIDFSNDRHHGTSVTMIGNADGVLIPTQFIKTGRDVYAFYYYVGDNFGQTEHVFRLPNDFRPDRTEEVPEPEQESLIEQAISALNTAVAQTALDVQTTTQKASEATESARSASISERNAADSAETAVNAKNAAEGYAEDAISAKNQAVASATSANESANTATVKASEASTNAITASVKADEARASAASASNDAGIASASAQSASQSAESAEASEMASRGWAESAEDYAQSAEQSELQASASATASAQSASQSAQIKSDVESLADDAQGYANSASQSASASANFASDAQGYANSASASAQSASGYASQAQTSAQTSSSKASEASTSAQTASTKATEASQSASQALSYKTDAESAKTASQTAQGLAESARDDAIDAKTDAESARDEAQTLVDSISGKVEQIDSNTERIESLEDDRYKPYVTDSASGSIASFPDGADGIPLKSLVVDINPVQDLSQGDPSPENICPISGWEGMNVSATGINILDVAQFVPLSRTTIDEVDGNTGKIAFTATASYYGVRIRIPIRKFAGKNVAFSALWPTSPKRAEIRIFDADENLVLNFNASNGGAFTIPTNAVTFQMTLSNSTTVNTQIVYEHLQLEVANHVSAFEPFGQFIPISWQSEAGTVYGGKVDVLSGVLRVTHEKAVVSSFAGVFGQTTNGYAVYTTVGKYTHVVPYAEQAKMKSNIFTYARESRQNMRVLSYGGNDEATQTQTYILPNTITSLAEANEWLSALETPLECTFYLATPIEIQLTPHEVNSLLGQNNIFADTGDSAVEYRADAKLYIEKLTQPEEDDMVANSAIASGQFFMIGNSLYKALTAIASGATITVGTNAQRVSLSDALNLVNA